MAESGSLQPAGKVALVTGATGIIGPTICAVLQREGWRVAACATSDESFEYAEGIHGVPVAGESRFVAELAGRDACRALVEQVEDRMGPIGLLVNNAATNDRAKLSEVTESSAERVLAVNVLAPLWLVQASADSLAAQNGSIVNVSSVTAATHQMGFIVYPVAKAALEKLTEILAVELGPSSGVRVNAVRVGAVPGSAFMRDTLQSLPANEAAALYAEIMPKHRKASKHRSLLARAGSPNDVAEAIAFLASAQADFINGTILDVDGGWRLKWDDLTTSPSGFDKEKAVAEWLKQRGTQT